MSQPKLSLTFTVLLLYQFYCLFVSQSFFSPLQKIYIRKKYLCRWSSIALNLGNKCLPIKLGASHVAVALLLALPVVGEDADAVQAVVVEAPAVDVAVRVCPFSHVKGRCNRFQCNR